jgi:hypothetical protein
MRGIPSDLRPGAADPAVPVTLEPTDIEPDFQAVC